MELATQPVQGSSPSNWWYKERKRSLAPGQVSNRVYSVKHVFAPWNGHGVLRRTFKARARPKVSYYPDCHLSHELVSKMKLIKAYQDLCHEKEPNQKVMRPKSSMRSGKRQSLGNLINQHAQLIANLNRKREGKCKQCERFTCNCRKVQFSLVRGDLTHSASGELINTTALKNSIEATGRVKSYARVGKL